MVPGIKNRALTFSDLMMYAVLLVKHGRMIVLLFCLSLMCGLTYFVYAKPVYYSLAVIHYKTLALPVDAQSVYADSTSDAITKGLSAPHIIMRTARRLGFRGSDKELEAKYLRKMTVSFNSLGNINIEVYPYIASWARLWPETLMQEYLAFRDEQRIVYRDSALKAFTSEMEKISQKMESVLTERFHFQDTNEVTRAQLELNKFKSVPLQLSMISHRLSERDQIRKSLQDPNLDHVAKLSLISSISDGTGLDVGQVLSDFSMGQVTPNRTVPGMKGATPPQVVVVPDMVSNNSNARKWQELERSLRRAVDLRKDYDRIYLPSHPKMAAVNKQIAGLDKELSGEYEAAKNKFDLEYAKLLDQQRELQGKLADYDRANRNYEKILQSASQFDAGQLAWNSMYAELAKQVTTFDFGADKERARLNYLGIMEIRDFVPVSPNRLKVMIISLLLGLTLSIGIPFLFEYLDYTLSDVAEVEGLLKMRGLGIIPKVMEGRTEKFPLLGDTQKSARHLVENFRVIRTNLVLNNTKSKVHQVIMVASAMPKEGKTTISANLAISFAEKGEKTLLIDCDLRRGRMHRVFGLSTSPGLSNVLLEKTSMDEACRRTAHENLDLLGCGKHAAGATEMLGEAVFENLLGELRQKYQRIIVDTPPVLGLSETSMMQRMVDGVMFVISSNHTPTRSVKAAIDILQANGANFYGFVLNRIDLTTSSNYYNYYYYSYQYYDNYQTLEKPS